METREQFVDDQKHRFFREVVGRAVLANSKNRKTEEAYIRELTESVRRMGYIAWIPELDAISIDEITERIDKERMFREAWCRDLYEKAVRLPNKWRIACAEKFGEEDLLRLIWKNMHDSAGLNQIEQWLNAIKNQRNERIQINIFKFILGAAALGGILSRFFT